MGARLRNAYDEFPAVIARGRQVIPEAITRVQRSYAWMISSTTWHRLTSGAIASYEAAHVERFHETGVNVSPPDSAAFPSKRTNKYVWIFHQKSKQRTKAGL